jgi:hypothetical protein
MLQQRSLQCLLPAFQQFPCNRVSLRRSQATCQCDKESQPVLCVVLLRVSALPSAGCGDWSLWHGIQERVLTARPTLRACISTDAANDDTAWLNPKGRQNMGNVFETPRARRDSHVHHAIRRQAPLA